MFLWIRDEIDRTKNAVHAKTWHLRIETSQNPRAGLEVTKSYIVEQKPSYPTLFWESSSTWE